MAFRLFDDHDMAGLCEQGGHNDGKHLRHPYSNVFEVTGLAIGFH